MSTDILIRFLEALTKERKEEARPAAPIVQRRSSPWPPELWPYALRKSEEHGQDK